MTDKPLEMSLLFDFYGEILTDKQRELFDLYHNEDLSLTEIAENTGVSRQAVRDSIVRAEHTLRQLEDKLGLVAKFGRLEQLADSIRRQAEQLRSLGDPAVRDISDTLLAIAGQIETGDAI